MSVPKLITYADDILVLVRSKGELEGKMSIIAQYFGNFGLRLAESKTVTMTWNTPAEVRVKDTLFEVNSTPLDNVTELKYFGHVLTND